jgi:hypothetical protein
LRSMHEWKPSLIRRLGEYVRPLERRREWCRSVRNRTL